MFIFIALSAHKKARPCGQAFYVMINVIYEIANCFKFALPQLLPLQHLLQIGRASCRERVY